MKTRRHKHKGGNIIGSGGYGCVFRPSLKCRGQSRTKKKMVSKLMETKYAQQEYNEIVQYKNILNTIPNYQDYFLLENITICDPDKIDKSDLTNYIDKCHALNQDYGESYINAHLDEFKILTIPDGGIDLEKYMKNIEYATLPSVNNRLIDLLVHGIIPMNKLGILHADIKQSNILINNKHAKLIDWGLAFMFSFDKIPLRLKDRQISYNLPFSIILFNRLFDEMYANYLKEPTQTPHAFMKQYVNYYFEYQGSGHFNGIKRAFKMVFMDTWNEDTAIDFIVDYLVKVVQAHTSNKKFNSLSYFTKVFIHIADIWGMLTCYGSIMEHLHLSYTLLNKAEKLLFNKLKANILTYVYYAHTSQNDVNKLYSTLVPELLALNKLFINCSKFRSPINFSQTTNRMPSLPPTQSITTQRSQKIMSKIKKQIHKML